MCRQHNTKNAQEMCQWELITERTLPQWHGQRTPPCYQLFAVHSCCLALLELAPVGLWQSSLRWCRRYDESNNRNNNHCHVRALNTLCFLVPHCCYLVNSVIACSSQRTPYYRLHPSVLYLRLNQE